MEPTHLWHRLVGGIRVPTTASRSGIRVPVTVIRRRGGRGAATSHRNRGTRGVTGWPTVAGTGRKGRGRHKGRNGSKAGVHGVVIHGFSGNAWGGITALADRRGRHQRAVIGMRGVRIPATAAGAATRAQLGERIFQQGGEPSGLVLDGRGHATRQRRVSGRGMCGREGGRVLPSQTQHSFQFLHRKR